MVIVKPKQDTVPITPEGMRTLIAMGVCMGWQIRDVLELPADSGPCPSESVEVGVLKVLNDIAKSRPTVSPLIYGPDGELAPLGN